MEQTNESLSMIPIEQKKAKKKELTAKRRHTLETYLEYYIEHNGNGTQAYCHMVGVDYTALDYKEKNVKRKQAERLFTDVHFTRMLEEHDDHNCEKHKIKREDMLDVLETIAASPAQEATDRIRAAMGYLTATQGATMIGARAGANVTLNPDGSLAVNIAIENTSTAIDEFNRETGFNDDKNE